MASYLRDLLYTILMLEVLPAFRGVDWLFFMPAALFFSTLESALGIYTPFLLYQIVEGVASDDGEDALDASITIIGDDFDITVQNALLLFMLLFTTKRASSHAARYFSTFSEYHVFEYYTKKLIEKQHRINFHDHENQFKPNFSEYIFMETYHIPRTLTFHTVPFLINWLGGSSLIGVQFKWAYTAPFVIYVPCYLLASQLLQAIPHISPVVAHEKRISEINKFLNQMGQSTHFCETIRLNSRELYEEKNSKYRSQKSLEANKESVYNEMMWQILDHGISITLVAMAIGMIAQGGFTQREITDFLYMIQFGVSLMESTSLCSKNLVEAMRNTRALRKMKRSLLSLSEELANDSNSPVGYQAIPFVEDMSNSILQFDDVSFRYPGAKEYTLRNISFAINPGDKIGLVGKSGCGKTTLLRLLFRLYEPTEGQITLDKRDIKTIPIKIYRQFFAYVPQYVDIFTGEYLEYNIGYAVPNSEPFLRELKSSIRIFEEEEHLEEDLDLSEDNVPKENIKLLEEHIDLDQQMSPEQNIKLKDMSERNRFVDCVNTAIDSVALQEKRKNKFPLSGGQSQRVGIARLLAKHSPFFIFDEPTASLDKETEDVVMGHVEEALQNNHPGGRSVLVSHREETLRSCNRICELKEGHLTEYSISL